MNLFDAINTPERRAEALRLRDELMQEYGARLAQHPAQANFLYGQGREQAALDQLNALAQAGADAMGEIARESRESDLFTQLAEGLALQGRFEEAAQLTRSGPHRDDYRRKAAAVKALGERACQCPAEVRVPSPTDAKGEARETQVKVEEVWDGKQTLAFFKCSVCGAVSARA